LFDDSVMRPLRGEFYEFHQLQLQLNLGILIPTDDDWVVPTTLVSHLLWEGKNPGSVRRLLADPRWEKRFVHFLELSGVGRTLADGIDEESAYAARMDTWIAWETEDVAEVERLTPRGDG
jgi:hypothetical protein